MDDLLRRITDNGLRIRGIWIADVAHQGASGVLNENKIGNERKYIYYNPLRPFL